MVIRRRNVAIFLFAASQLAVLLVYLKHYSQTSVTVQPKKQQVRININGRSVVCFPRGNDTVSPTFYLFCGDEYQDVLLETQGNQTVVHATTLDNASVKNTTNKPPETNDDTVKDNVESPTIQTRTLDSVFEGFPDEYLYVNDHAKRLDLHCSDCALVSTSGQMLGTGAGAEIDNATCVIRMNAAHVEGYEKDVGTRTTLRMVSFIVVQSKALITKDIFGKPSHPEKTVLWSSYAPKVFPNVFRSYTNMSSHYPNIDFYYATKKQMEYTDALFFKETGKNRNNSGSWLSTGWFTMVLALHMCDELKVYGMVESDYCESGQTPKVDVPYHYYDANGSTECNVYKAGETRRNGAHRFMTEKYIFRKWAEIGNISFHYPSWNITKSPKKKPLFLSSPGSKYGKSYVKKKPVRPVRRG